jgi:sugar/nucleoside kinase (ribokinase family)
VHVLKLAEEEAEAIGALEEDGLRRLAVPEIVVTLGSRGSLVWTRGRLESVPAQTVRRVADPTGAGDAFAVAYLAARGRGYAPVPAARRASLIVAALLRP